jgi:hypothetical protein
MLIWIVLIWIVLLLVAGSVATFTARFARERGRSGTGWAALGVTAAIVGQAGGILVFGVAVGGDATSLSMGRVVWGFLASLLGPMACMVAVLGILWRLPARVPEVGGTRWSVHRMSTKDTPGSECMLSVEEGRLILGTEIVVEAKDVTDIAVDGECLRLSWAGQSVYLVPTAKPEQPRSSRERTRWTLGLCKRLRILLGRASMQ